MGDTLIYLFFSLAIISIFSEQLEACVYCSSVGYFNRHSSSTHAVLLNEQSHLQLLFKSNVGVTIVRPPTISLNYRWDTFFNVHNFELVLEIRHTINNPLVPGKGEKYSNALCLLIVCNPLNEANQKWAFTHFRIGFPIKRSV